MDNNEMNDIQIISLLENVKYIAPYYIIVNKIDMNGGHVIGMNSASVKNIMIGDYVIFNHYLSSKYKNTNYYIVHISNIVTLMHTADKFFIAQAEMLLNKN